MIPRFAIDQANKAYTGWMKKAWDGLMLRINTCYKSYWSTHNNVQGSLESAKTVASRKRQAALNDATRAFRQTTVESGGDAWSTYDQKKNTIEAEYSSDIEHAQHAADESARVAEEEFRVAKMAALKWYKEEVDKTFTMYEEALP